MALNLLSGILIFLFKVQRFDQSGENQVKKTQGIEALTIKPSAEKTPLVRSVIKVTPILWALRIVFSKSDSSKSFS